MSDTNWIQRLVALLDAIKAITDALPDAGALTTIQADLTTLGTRLSAARAGYLDELDFDLQGLLNTIAAYLTTEIADILTDTGTTIPALLATIQADLDNPTQYMANLTTLETRLSAVRAGYLDELAAANLPADIAALNTLLSHATYGLSAIETLVDELETRLSAVRAGYLDQLDFALQEAIAAIPTTMVGTNNAALASAWTAALATALASYTAVRGGYLDELDFDLQGLLNTIAGYLTTEIADILAETDQLPNVQHETEWASTATIQALANAAATALTVGSITPTYPTGATRVRAILIATIHVANKTAVAHHIKFKIEGQKAAGGYGNLLDLTAQEGLSMVDVDGATDGWSGAIDVTSLVDTSGAAYDFRFNVDSDNAGNVIYICSFVLALVYTM